MSLEIEIRELRSAVQVLTEVVRQDTAVRQRIWEDTTRASFEAIPLTNGEVEAMTEGAETELPTEPSVPTPEDALDAARRLIEADKKRALRAILEEHLGGTRVSDLDAEQRITFCRLADEALQRETA